MRKQSGIIIYSPTDLIRYLASPFASWLDRYYLENPEAIAPDKQTEEEELLSRTGDKHEQSVLSGYKASTSVIEIAKGNFDTAHAVTLAAIKDRAPMIYQAALGDGVFAGFADFLILDGSGKYQVWDTKLALSPKPYYPIQLCCYSEMLAATTGQEMPERIGSFWGTVIASSSGSRISSIITVTSKTVSLLCRLHSAETWTIARNRCRVLNMDDGARMRRASSSTKTTWFRSQVSPSAKLKSR
jgi:predicted RecB family nuclease